jgi:hypothetical protein
MAFLYKKEENKLKNVFAMMRAVKILRKVTPHHPMLL